MWSNIKAFFRAMFRDLKEEDPPTPIVPKIPLHRPGPSQNPVRSVFLGTWGTGGLVRCVKRTIGQGPMRSGAFHQVILVNDGLAGEKIVSNKTEAKLIDWGMHPNPNARIRDFDYNHQMSKGDKYEYVGATHWTNKQIQTLISKLAHEYAQYHTSMHMTHAYNWDNNNCRHMAKDAIQAIIACPVKNNDDEAFIESVAEVIINDRRIMAYENSRIRSIHMMDGPGSADIKTIFDETQEALGILKKQGRFQILDPDWMGWDSIRGQNGVSKSSR